MRWRGGAPGCDGGDAIEAEPFGAPGPRRGDVQMASLGREFPCENRGVPGDCDKRDKTGMSHAAAIHLAAGVIAAKQLSTGPKMITQPVVNMPYVLFSHFR